MIKQTNPRLSPEMNHFACAFDCAAYFREAYQGKPWMTEELQTAWNDAIKSGIISGDLNHNGQLGDIAEELVIQDWQKLVDFLGCNLKFLRRDKPGTADPENFVIAEWFNPRTNFHHFVIGEKRPVEWDPIDDGSVTVREGYCLSIRIFEKL
jgi:hypothetical protein